MKKSKGYSFVVITNGKRPEKLANTLRSIWDLKAPEYEIIVVGNIREGSWSDMDTPHIDSFIRMNGAAELGRLGSMRNEGCHASTYDHLIVSDDDIIFGRDFYAGLVNFGEDYDIMSVRIKNPDGTRFWDWAIHGPFGHHLIDYTETSPYLYVTGGMIVMKSYVFDKVQWDPVRGFYQEEDVDFSTRAKAAGFSIKFNPYCTVTHDDPRYTQDGVHILRKPSPESN
jgi:hypothetical protein